MKSYKKIKFKKRFPFRDNLILIVKLILKIPLIKKLIYKIIFNLKDFFYKIKSESVRGLIYDVLSDRQKYIEVKNKKNEKFIIFSNDKDLSRELFINNEFDLKKLERTINFLSTKKKIRNLYDIGANIGVTSIPAIKRGLANHAYAVEPEINNFDLLKKNIILNDVEKNISTYNYALSNKDNIELEMEISDNNSGDHRVRLPNPQMTIHNENTRSIIKVTSKKFDSLFQNLDENNDLVWIDAQGYEPIILEGAQNLLLSRTPLVIEFWPYGLKRNNLWEKIDSIFEKYDYFIDLNQDNINKIDINKNTLNELKNGWENEKKNNYSLFTDILLIKN